MKTSTQRTVEPGDVFYTSWGYDQTNIDYLIVDSVSPSGKTARCRMATAVNVGSQGCADTVTPGEAYSEPFTMQVRQDGDSVRLRGSYPYCPGDKRLDTFHRTKPGDTHYQTNPMFGH